MSGWFSKASNVFRRAVPEVEQRFELTCDCGQAHHGLRRSRAQKIVCRDCGSTRFVLPRDVYPPPRDARREPKPVPEPLPVLKPVEETKPEKIDLEREESAVATVARDAKPKPARKPTRPEFLVAADRRFWSPFRLVSLGIACVLLTIVVVLVQKQRRDYATKVLRTAGDEAAEFVDQQNWPRARERFEAAVKAIGVLKRDDVAARRMQQGLRETTALTGLSAGSLVDLLEDAEKQAEDPEAWQRTFNLRYRDQWLGIESPLKKSEDDAGDEWQIEFPGTVGERNREVVIHANLDVFSVVGNPPPEQALIFAAQLESCELSKDKKRWEVRLRKDTGFLWCDPRTYAGLGFTFNEWHTEAEVLATLKEQARRVDIPVELDQLAKGDLGDALPGGGEASVHEKDE
jgi:hypothetical protein